MSINWNLATQQPDFNAIAQRGLKLGQDIAKYNSDKEMEGVYEKLTGLMQDPDFELESSSEFPALLAQRKDLAEAAMMRYEKMGEKRQKQYTTEMIKARDAYYLGEPEEALRILGKRVARLAKEDKRPDDSLRAFQLFQTQPEKFVEGVDLLVRAETGVDYSMDGMNKNKGTANIQDYEYFEALQKIDPEGAVRFANKAGLSRLSPKEAARLEIETAERKVSDKERALRIAGFASNGVAAADGLAVMARSMELLRSIKTGGVQNAILGAKRFFGIDAADEGELAFNLGLNVLGQLKSTFGAAFTAGEMQELQKIEAGFGKSAETNIRLLQSAYNKAERAAKRGVRAAKDAGDDFTATEIKIALDRSYLMIEGMKKNGLNPNDNPANSANLVGDGTVTATPKDVDDDVIDFANYGAKR